jgi:hypothetical protein
MDDRPIRMRCLELATVAGGLGTPMEPVGRRLGQAEIGCAGHRRGRRYV